MTHYDTTEKEGMDREEIGLPGVQLDLLKAIASQCDTPIVVVLFNGGPLAIEWLVESPRVEAIVEGWYPGVNGGTAVAEVLLGKYAPAGKLPVTMYHANYTKQIAETSMDMRSYPGRTHQYLQVPVLFPFGYGLSYTTWKYAKEIVLDRTSGTATVVVSNVGRVGSDEVVLLFSRYVVGSGDAHVHQAFGTLPQQALVDFQRVKMIQPGETRNVTFAVDTKVFSLVDLTGEKRIVPGQWELFAGHGMDKVATTLVSVVV